MATLNYKIANNYKTLYKGNADMIVVPGISGDIGIIASKRLFTSLLTNGAVYIFENNKVKASYFVFSGTCVANELEISIASDEIYNLAEINSAEIDSLIAKYQALLNKSEAGDISSTNSGDVKDDVEYYKQKINAYQLIYQKLAHPEYK